MSKNTACNWKELYEMEEIEQENEEDKNNRWLKISILVIITLFMIGIFGLVLKISKANNINKDENPSTLCYVEETSYGTIFYDTNTKVMYIYKECGGAFQTNGCCITPMYNPDGSLKLWTGDEG